MGAAAEWSAISCFAPAPHEDSGAAAPFSVTNLTWSQQQAIASSAPLFGSRRQWPDYSCETTGYGSLELGGPSAYRVTIVRPGDTDALRQQHRLVRGGRTCPAWYRRQLDASRVHVVEREALLRHRADERGSWLFAVQRIAWLCAADDEVAQTAGPALRQLLWTARHHLGARDVADVFHELRHVTETLARERRSYVDAVERRVTERLADPSDDVAWSIRDLVAPDIESVRLEVRVLAEVRREWGRTG